MASWQEIMGVGMTHPPTHQSSMAPSLPRRGFNALQDIGREYGKDLANTHHRYLNELRNPIPEGQTNAFISAIQQPPGQGPLSGDMDRPAWEGILEQVIDVAPMGVAGTIAKKAGKSIPMDEASRMGRARDMGMREEYLHGTGANIKEFKPKDLSVKPSSHYLDIGIHGTKNPQTADMYAQYSQFGANKGISTGLKKGNPSVYPIMMKADNPLNITKGIPDSIKADLIEFGIDSGLSERSKYIFLIDKNPLDFLGVVQRKAGREKLKKFLVDHGYDAVDYKWQGKSNRMVFNPKNIRSKFAKFDPSKADSADILAGAAAVGLGASATWQQILGVDDGQ